MKSKFSLCLAVLWLAVACSCSGQPNALEVRIVAYAIGSDNVGRRRVTVDSGTNRVTSTRRDEWAGREGSWMVHHTELGISLRGAEFGTIEFSISRAYFHFRNATPVEAVVQFVEPDGRLLASARVASGEQWRGPAPDWFKKKQGRPVRE